MSTPTATQPETITDKLIRLSKNLQFYWFIGHLTLLLSSLRYLVSYATFNYYSKTAQFSYRLAFVAAAATYGIVVYKSFKARMKTTRRAMPADGPVGLLSDENIQYLLMAFVWLFSKQVALALLPFCVYSTFHCLNYIRGNFLQKPAATNGAAPKAGSGGLSDTIGNFVKSNYDRSMFLVALLEVSLWFRLFLSAIMFAKGSWILLGVYTVFLRTRIAQSKFLIDAIQHLTATIDNAVAQQNIPPAVKNIWNQVKGGAKAAHDATDLNKAKVPQKTQ